jgi:hypothetical protein
MLENLNVSDHKPTSVPTFSSTPTALTRELIRSYYGETRALYSVFLVQDVAIAKRLYFSAPQADTVYKIQLAILFYYSFTALDFGLDQIWVML